MNKTHITNVLYDTLSLSNFVKYQPERICRAITQSLTEKSQSSPEEKIFVNGDDKIMVISHI